MLRRSFWKVMWEMFCNSRVWILIHKNNKICDDMNIETILTFAMVWASHSWVPSLCWRHYPFRQYRCDFRVHPHRAPCHRGFVPPEAWPYYRYFPRPRWPPSSHRWPFWPVSLFWPTCHLCFNCALYPEVLGLDFHSVHSLLKALPFSSPGRHLGRIKFTAGEKFFASDTNHSEYTPLRMNDVFEIFNHFHANEVSNSGTSIQI